MNGRAYKAFIEDEYIITAEDNDFCRILFIGKAPEMW